MQRGRLSVIPVLSSASVASIELKTTEVGNVEQRFPDILDVQRLMICLSKIFIKTIPKVIDVIRIVFW